MLYAGSDDGVYRLADIDDDEASVEQVLTGERMFRVRQFDGVEGIFAASDDGLYHSTDGENWRRLPVGMDQVYAVTASPDGERLYAGTRPSRVYVAQTDDALAGDPDAWRELEGFRRLRERVDWGIPRHDGISQIRSLQTHPAKPDRIVVGIEVGGVHVSEDDGETWEDRHIEGFEAPHTDDVHHLTLDGPDTFVASTGSGLYRSGDAGRSWKRLDTDTAKEYFREAFASDGRVYAGAARGPSPTWPEDDDHVLLSGTGERPLDAVTSPVPEEVPIGWTTTGETIVMATHGGTLLEKRGDQWERVGEIPVPGRVRNRYMPLCWRA